jgi:hypothetical protein
MIALTISLGLLIGKIPAVIKIIMTGDCAVVVSISVGVLPTRRDEELV